MLNINIIQHKGKQIITINPSQINERYIRLSNSNNRNENTVPIKREMCVLPVSMRVCLGAKSRYPSQSVLLHLTIASLADNRNGRSSPL